MKDLDVSVKQPVIPTSPLRLHLAIVPVMGLVLCDADGLPLGSQLHVACVNRSGDIPTVTVTFAIADEVQWDDPRARAADQAAEMR